MSAGSDARDVTDAPVDGRTARRDRNRLAVLDAMIDMFAEDIEPGPEEVAARCGLSPRSVYRYFEDRDELLRAAIERQLERIYPLQLIHEIGQGELDDRIDRFVNARVRLYEAVADTSRAARHRARRNATIREQVGATQEALREQIARHFAPELTTLSARTRRSTLCAIDALTQFETLDYFCHVQKISTSAVRMIVADSLQTLLSCTDAILDE